MYASSAAGALASLSPEAKLVLANGAKAEEIAHDILWRKRMLVDLDRQRQECTQALATLRDKKPAAAGSAAAAAASSTLPPSQVHAPPPSKLWVSLSTNFVRLPRAHVVDLLRRDRARLDAEIETVRAEMKERMKALQTIAPSLALDKGLLDFALA